MSKKNRNKKIKNASISGLKFDNEMHREIPLSVPEGFMASYVLDAVEERKKQREAVVNMSSEELDRLQKEHQDNNNRNSGLMCSPLSTKLERTTYTPQTDEAMSIANETGVREPFDHMEKPLTPFLAGNHMEPVPEVNAGEFVSDLVDKINQGGFKPDESVVITAKTSSGKSRYSHVGISARQQDIRRVRHDLFKDIDNILNIDIVEPKYQFNDFELGVLEKTSELYANFILESFKPHILKPHSPYQYKFDTLVREDAKRIFKTMCIVSGVVFTPGVFSNYEAMSKSQTNSIVGILSKFTDYSRTTDLMRFMHLKLNDAHIGMFGVKYKMVDEDLYNALVAKVRIPTKLAVNRVEYAEYFRCLFDDVEDQEDLVRTIINRLNEEEFYPSIYKDDFDSNIEPKVLGILNGFDFSLAELFSRVKRNYFIKE